ncbi:hypothetical protein [Sagittula sp.]|uniref:hypothetical protein n=1 Tax=Sagittula sp. TaxID=2038081 RepID=UPI003512343B
MRDEGGDAPGDVVQRVAGRYGLTEVPEQLPEGRIEEDESTGGIDDPEVQSDRVEHPAELLLLGSFT